MMAPIFWPIERKTKKYAVAPSAGPHSKMGCIPLGIILRDNLSVAENMREVKELLKKGIVMIDGKKRKDHGFPAGLMDVVSVGDEHYRILTGGKGLYLQRIENKEANIKLCRVEDRRSLRKGKVQISLHDGSNILSDIKCSTGDVLVVNVPEISVKGVLNLEKDSSVLITAGHNMGKVGKLANIKVTRTSQPNQAIVSLGDRSVSIPRDFVFVVGKDKPVIGLR